MSPEVLHIDAPPRTARLAAHGEVAARAWWLREAREEGERAGRAAAGALLERAVEGIAAARAEAEAALARTATELALEIARVILRHEIPEGHYALERIVRETLHESGVGRNPCVVHLHPTDLAALSEVRFRTGTRLEADEGVSRGDVHVETSLGVLVRDVESTLESIARRLRESLA